MAIRGEIAHVQLREALRLLTASRKHRGEKDFWQEADRRNCHQRKRVMGSETVSYQTAVPWEVSRSGNFILSVLGSY